MHDSRNPNTYLLDGAVPKSTFPRFGASEGLQIIDVKRLEARADPNYDAGANKLSPLRNVLCFAHDSNVSEMRELLLDYGAREKHDDRKRWRTRQSADMNETTWLMRFNKDDRPLLRNVDE